MLAAAEKMGILDPNADRVPIQRIARFFLNDFANTNQGKVGARLRVCPSVVTSVPSAEGIRGGRRGSGRRI